MGEGFEVDLYALRQAADAVARVTDAVTTRPIDSSPSPPEALGHAGLEGAVEEFLRQWQEGVEELCTDGRQIADHLRGAADAYTRSDEQGQRALDGVLRTESGPDPAAPR